MTVHHARGLALAAVLVGISALGPKTHHHGQQDLDGLPIEDVRALAEQDDPAAQASLGDRHLEGLGVPQDHAEALRWYRRAARQPQAPACARSPA